MTPTETSDLLDLRHCRVLDGGLATELEYRGVSLDGPLWSARALRDDPASIVAVHRDYLEAGADCLITASYQASTLGYAEAFASQENVVGFEVDAWAELPPGAPATAESSAEAAVEFSAQARIFAMARSAARSALTTAVRLADEARAQYRTAGNSRPVLIAASLGPYGAALHNGAEFHGNYHISFSELVDFHHERIAVLAPAMTQAPSTSGSHNLLPRAGAASSLGRGPGVGLLSRVPSSSSLDRGGSPDQPHAADLLAFETVPSLEEARAILTALASFPTLSAWVSFSCRDEEHVAHGESIRSCARLLDAAPQVLAVGINCTAPVLITPLLAQLRAGTSKPAIVYPNSGEGWDAVCRCWTGTPDVDGYGALAEHWYAAGAQIVGGCCRTGPAHIRAVAAVAALQPERAQ